MINSKAFSNWYQSGGGDSEATNAVVTDTSPDYQNTINTTSLEGNAIAYSRVGHNSDLADLATFFVINELVNADYASFMRNEKKIGYHVGVKVSNVFHSPLLIFIASSNDEGQAVLTQATEEFIKSQMMRLTDDEIQLAKLRAMSDFIGQHDAPQSALTVMQLSKRYGLAQDDEFSKRVMAEIKLVSHKSILSTVFDHLTLTD